jgi:hypothetical protein
MLMRRLQLVQVKMNGVLLEGEVLSRCAKSVLAMLDYEAGFESMLDDLLQFEEEEQPVRTEQEGAGDLLSNAESSVAFESRNEVVDLFAVRREHTTAPRRRLGGYSRRVSPQNANEQAGQRVTPFLHNFKKSRSWRSRKQVSHVEEPICC